MEQVANYYYHAKDFYTKEEALRMTDASWSKLKFERVMLKNFKAQKVFAILDEAFTGYEQIIIRRIQERGDNAKLLKMFSTDKKAILKQWLSSETPNVSAKVSWFVTSTGRPAKPFIEVTLECGVDCFNMRFISKKGVFPTNDQELLEWVSKHINQLY